MIVVVGSPVARLVAGRLVADGASARIAVAVSAAGRPVQIVGRIGDDSAADAVLQDLARAGVGHVAILRDQARPTPVRGATFDATSGATSAGSEPIAMPEADAADIDLALRYLTEFRVIVLVEPATSAVAAVVARASAWGEAALVIASSSPTRDTDAADAPEAGGDRPTTAQVVRRADPESESDFAERVAALAVALDSGLVPAD